MQMKFAAGTIYSMIAVSPRFVCTDENSGLTMYGMVVIESTQ